MLIFIGVLRSAFDLSGHDSVEFVTINDAITIGVGSIEHLLELFLINVLS